MKIGIMTFHWATNYGAVLQAYALQQALSGMGHDAVLIDYYPAKFKKTFLNCLRLKRIYLIPKSLKSIGKEKKIEVFRKKYLKRTAYYSQSTQLHSTAEKFDCYICGSDQIWNQSFVRSSERKNNMVYFLNFAPEGKIIASYAASFGATTYPEDLQKDLKEVLLRFDAISVREQSGVEIINRLGIEDVQMVPDPTLLLTAEVYESLLCNKENSKYACLYMLHGKQKDAVPLVNDLKERDFGCVCCDGDSVEKWLETIRFAEFVVTNSFHGIVFSILFHRPFAAILIEGSGMNDRITTLLEVLGLSDRIYKGDYAMLDAEIDWAKVDKELEAYRQCGYDFLKRILKQN